MVRALLLGSLVLALVLPAVAAAQSQATTGVIRGVVSDPAGAPVPNATVLLRETQTGFQRQLTTNARGVFTASLLPLGIYDVTARSVGLNEVRRTGIPLRVGETVDLALTLTAVELQAVTIEATEQIVDATRIESATRLPTEAVSGLPNNGRNYLNLTLLTPNVAIVQGPDGDELSIGGQKGIHNNVSVDGADFNNPFFGEHRGGQRPPFTFNLDAVQEIVVVAGGANAEFGRSSGGFVNVITKSGTNEFHGSAHYYGKDGALSGQPRHGGIILDPPDFSQHQFGFTLGGPIRRDRAFFFVAYDQQIFDETKQTDASRIDPALRAWMDMAYGGALADDYGPIARTNDARALMAKLDLRLSDRHNLSLKYNYAWSEQANGTFDVDSWARSANALERDFSNAINGSLISYLSANLSNEFRFQYSREDRPRPYEGPRSTLLGTNPSDPPAARPFPDVAMDFAGGYRFGMPFFIPVEYYDTRVQLLDNISFARGDHFFKMGFEYNRVHSIQTFVGFANSRYIFASVDDFLAFAADPNQSGGVLLYLQQAGIGRSVREAGTQDIPQTEYALYIQDTWKPSPKWTFNYGLRWEAQIQADPITAPSQVYYAAFIGQTVTNGTGTYTFPSDGTIPSDKQMFQPRFGFAFDPDGDGRRVLRGSAGLYYARIPGLNLASSRSTNGSVGMTYFRANFTGGVPAFGTQLPDNVAPTDVFFPDVFVFDKDFRNPRTLNLSLGYEWQLAGDLAGLISFTHARTDNVTRFINRNDAVFGSPWGAGLDDYVGGTTNGIFTLTTVESTAKSRYNGITVGVKRVLDPNFQFQLNYTLSFDKSDDDNERDPFSFRYARADSLHAEYNWSDRDQRHRINGWMLAHVGSGVFLNSRVSVYSAQPVSERCGSNNEGSGQRAASPAERICPNGSILPRNTLRKDNGYFSWDLGLTVPFNLGRQGRLEAIVQVFNVLGNENFRDPASTSLLFNFDGTIRSGLGDPQQAQIGLHWVF
ncbi:MAG: TonB-dependent receptor [Gemmatimonadales bacterium]|nr:TonB-dependent receptor [Gemmatimonadales bacterium]